MLKKKKLALLVEQDWEEFIDRKAVAIVNYIRTCIEQRESFIKRRQEQISDFNALLLKIGDAHEARDKELLIALDKEAVALASAATVKFKPKYT